MHQILRICDPSTNVPVRYLILLRLTFSPISRISIVPSAGEKCTSCLSPYLLKHKCTMDASSISIKSQAAVMVTSLPVSSIIATCNPSLNLDLASMPYITMETSHDFSYHLGPKPRSHVDRAMTILLLPVTLSDSKLCFPPTPAHLQNGRRMT